MKALKCNGRALMAGLLPECWREAHRQLRRLPAAVAAAANRIPCEGQSTIPIGIIRGSRQELRDLLADVALVACSARIGTEVTGDDVCAARPGRARERVFPPADVPGPRAARMEPASGRQVDRARRLAEQFRPGHGVLVQPG